MDKFKCLFKDRFLVLPKEIKTGAVSSASSKRSSLLSYHFKNSTGSVDCDDLSSSHPWLFPSMIYMEEAD